MDIGPYRIIRQLGQGGQGTVYLGRDEHGGLAAVKVMNSGIDRAFAREIAAARQVDEFCTARVLRADLDHRPPYVASEYIDGPALAAIAPMRGAALTRLAIGTATALAAIHRAGVVHRDFKPANVLIGPDGPRVIDFGIARLVDLTATKDSTSGTPPYMAPEQFSGRPVGPASDVFAWGSTMVYAANGRPPFGSDTFAATAYRILHSEPDLGVLTEPLRGIVARCLAKDPAHRPSARDLLLVLLGERAPDQEDAALRQGAEAAHGGAVQAGGSVRERPTAERGSGGISRRALLAAGGAVVAAAATTGVVLWRGATGRSNVPVGVLTGSPAPTTTGPAAPPTPGDLPIALASAVGATPMADFSFEGSMPQGTWSTKAKGQLSYDHDAVSSLDTRMDMTVTAEHIELTKRVVLADAEYVDGKEVTDPSKEPIMPEARCPRAMGAVGVIIDLARLTENVKAAGRRYSGALVTSKAPTSLRQQISALGGPERTEQELDRTSLSWQLTLDGQNRPARFELAWHFKLDEVTQLTAGFSTAYSKWREGELREPGSQVTSPRTT